MIAVVIAHQVDNGWQLWIALRIWLNLTARPIREDVVHVANSMQFFALDSQCLAHTVCPIYELHSRHHIRISLDVTFPARPIELASVGHCQMLAHSLNVLGLPPLSERRSDIAPLTRHLLARIGGLPGMKPVGATDDALRLLAGYSWPGNVRQLQDVLFRAAVATRSEVLNVADFPALEAALGGGATENSDVTINGEGIGVTLYLPDGNLRPLEDIEADVIRLAIGHYRGRMSEVARRLGIGRSTLYRKLTDLGIDTAA